MPMLLANLILDTLNDLEALRRKLEVLRSHIESDSGKHEEDLLKKPNGRLTEAGIRRIYAMVSAGYPDAEIARALDVRQSSVGPHRHRFLRERSKLK
jgi:hypothetical protein